MAHITISDLRNADSEIFINDLTHTDAMYVYGGEGYQFYQVLEFALIGLAMHTIALLVEMFITSNRSFVNH